MPKDSRKESHKKKIYNKPQQQHQMGTMDPSPLDPFHNFLNQHRNETNTLKNHVNKIQNTFEELFDQHQNANGNLFEIGEFLKEKKVNINEIVEKFDQLETEKMELIITVNNNMETIAKLECKFAEDIDKLSMELKEEKEKNAKIIQIKDAEVCKFAEDIDKLLIELKEEKEKNAKIIQIKDAERDDCLKDMEAKYDQKLQELQEQNVELNKKLQEMINQIDENKTLFEKQIKKTEKKNKIIIELKTKIATLEAENKEKEEALETQGLKMRDLQKVFDRQYQRVERLSTTVEHVEINDERRQLSNVEEQPTNDIVVEPNTQQAHLISPVILNQNNEIQATRNLPPPPVFDNTNSDNQDNRVPTSSNGNVLRTPAINPSVFMPQTLRVRVRRCESSDSDIDIPPYTNFSKRRRN